MIKPLRDNQNPLNFKELEHLKGQMTTAALTYNIKQYYMLV